MKDLDHLTVSKEAAGQRIDAFLSSQFEEKSRTYFQFLLENDAVFLNGQKVKKKTLVKEGDEIELFFILTPEFSLTPENIPLDILFEDEHLLAINKPSGMVVHPAPGNYSGTLVNALAFHCKNLPSKEGEPLRPGIVHRLDKDTSGIILAAKTLESHQKLISLFQKRKILKEYLCVCIGAVHNELISAPIGRDPFRRKEMTISPEGKEAHTQITSLIYQNPLSLAVAKPITGRTHQIRVHLKYRNTPILGDPVYGNKKWNQKFSLSKQLLHAHRIELTHPITGIPLNLTAPLPEDFKNFLSFFQKKTLPD